LKPNRLVAAGLRWRFVLASLTIFLTHFYAIMRTLKNLLTLVRGCDKIRDTWPRWDSNPQASWAVASKTTTWDRFSRGDNIDKIGCGGNQHQMPIKTVENLSASHFSEG